MIEDEKQNRYLFLFDFDGTLADTFSPSPHNIGVYEAYESAIEKIFSKSGLNIYKNSGGLQNRAPSEIVKSILGRPSKADTENLVKEKVRILLQEVGKSWPKPFDGVVALFKHIEELNLQGLNIDVGILSSGHTEFIEKTLKMWGVSNPQIFITDDELRYKYPILPKPKEDRLVKPSGTLFSIARSKWLRSHGIEPVGIDVKFALGTHERVAYFGDDIVKDGEFAANSKLLFGHFNDDDKNKDFELRNNSFSFSDWSKLNELILSKEALRSMQEGESIKVIFTEVFKELEKPIEKEKKIKMQ